jgi:rubrerythrin
MTNEEAQNEIVRNKGVFKFDATMTKALDLAIKALEEQERPTGEWIEGTQGFYCSKCDYYDRDYFEHNFCPNCGVTIKGVERWD